MLGATPDRLDAALGLFGAVSSGHRLVAKLNHDALDEGGDLRWRP
ncbi:hypothetical protein ACFQL1_24135 [Halomicroarcula sp. GCM10025709]